MNLIIFYRFETQIKIIYLSSKFNQYVKSRILEMLRIFFIVNFTIFEFTVQKYQYLTG